MKTLGFIFAIILAIVAIAIFGTSLGWFGAATQTVSAAHVREQWADAYTKHEALTAIAANVCGAEKLVNTATSDSERSQRQTQLVAQEQNYARVAAEYNAAMADGFRSKYVKPGDLPSRASTLVEFKATICQ